MASLGPYWVGDRPRDQVDVLIMRDGAPLSLAGYTAASIVLLDPAGVPVDTTGAGVGQWLDRVLITWPSDRTLFTMPGYYTLQIALTGPGVLDHAQTLHFRVEALAGDQGGTWATTRDVLTYTGVTVTRETLLQAQGIVELTSRVAYEATVDPSSPSGSKLKARDRRLLRQAVAYQAAFMAPTVELFGRAGVQTLNQDGMSASVGEDTTAWVLAPLAKQALKQVTWNRVDRTMHVGGVRRSGSLRALQDAWVRDEAGVTIWQPLGTAGRFPGMTDPDLPAGTTEWGA